MILLAYVMASLGTFIIGATVQPILTERAPMDRAMSDSGQFSWIVGRIARIPWQHLVKPPPGKIPIYVDTEGGGQTVAYAAEEPVCSGVLLMEGRTLLAEGPAKRPGSDERFAERQLDVTSWTCLDTTGILLLLERMVDQSVPWERKEAAEHGIIGAGLDAIPVLLGRLEDRRVCRHDQVLHNEGELPNHPPHGSSPGETNRDLDVTLGRFCDDMLRWIITPHGYQSPYASDPVSHRREDVFFTTEDWHAWWVTRRGMTLSQIRDQMKPVIDAYWQSNGEIQTVR